MQQDLFYRTGKLIYTLRWFILVGSIIGLLACLPILPNVMKPFSTTGFLDPTSESAIGNQLLKDQLGYSYNRFIILYHNPTWKATDPRFNKEVKKSLSNLKELPLKHLILYPDANSKQISKDKHTAYAILFVKSKQEVGHEFITQLKSLVTKPAHLTMNVGGEPVFLDDVTKQTQVDLNRAEYIGTPAAIVVLLLIFGSLIATFLPIVLGGSCAIVILSILYCLGQMFSLSIFTINIALLVGLCLSLDYALFIINRFRYEVLMKTPPREAVAITLSTAGKAVFFSGMAVFISLSALLFFPINVLFSVGVGGLTSVFVGVIVTLVVLPAILGIVYRWINFPKLNFFKGFHTHFWKNLITFIVGRPWFFFITSMIILLILSYPVLNIQFGISNFKILPKTSESRQFFDTFQEKFGANQLAPILLILKTPDQNILSKNNIGNLYDVFQTLKKDNRINEINSIVNVMPNGTKQQYQTIYTNKAQLPESLQHYLVTNTNSNFTVFTITSKYTDKSVQTTSFINDLREGKLTKKFNTQVTGSPANTLDVLNGISSIFPYAFAWVMVITYLILLVLLRSVVLPLKAILTTLLSLTASYGALVFIIQEGHFHELLQFDPQGILDISLCIIIFCALFGFSMDYEVFLLTRIKEHYERTGNTLQSIIFGIDQSSRIITSAAIIVIMICISFISADVLIVKAFGLGIAIAITVDAFLIRTILVPATMALLGKWNWYLPGWVARLIPNIFFNIQHH